MAQVPEHRSSRRWSTEDVDQRRALSYWIDTVCDRFLALDIDTPLRAHGFRARLEQMDLGIATASFLHAEPQRVHRTRAKIARSAHPVFILMQLRLGQVCLRQSGREAYVRAGECIFIDGAQPYELECPEPTQALALRLPEASLKRWIPHPECLAARLFSGSGWNSALNAALASLEVHSCEDLALPRGVVAEQITALLALAVGRDGSAAGRPKLFNALIGTLANRLHEPYLSPADVAHAHGVSKRSLHYAFAAAGTTFTEELMRLRLEQAREILSNTRFSGLTVTEVAARCGFNEASHFARRFRQRFSQAPAQFRGTATERSG
jgi:AraC-like DNA-binding protein